MSTILNKLTTLLEQIRQIHEQALVNAPTPKLIAVSKGHDATKVQTLLEGGHRLFGENRVQEAEAKFSPLRGAFPDLELHLIGPLQSNKAKEALALFDVIETIDRLKIAEAIAAQMGQAGCRTKRFLIQVNTGEEDQKSGVSPLEADDFIRDCKERLGLPITGLMCVPPVGAHPAPHFALLREIALRHGLSELSMGMSGDYEIALRLGATHVRIGTAIFGERVNS